MASLTVQGDSLVPEAAADDSIMEDLQAMRVETQSRLHELNKLRDGIESELDMLVEALESKACGAVGSRRHRRAEGFPRADVDLYDIRGKGIASPCCRPTTRILRTLRQSLRLCIAC